MRTTESPAGLTILVVEDERAILRLATLVLEREGFRVVGAESVEQALASARRIDVAPSLMITDVLLPGGDGESLARSLRERWPDLPVLFTSGEPMNGDGLPAGSAFLKKPFTPSDLVRAARELLGSPPA